MYKITKDKDEELTSYSEIDSIKKVMNDVIGNHYENNYVLIFILEKLIKTIELNDILKKYIEDNLTIQQNINIKLVDIINNLNNSKEYNDKQLSHKIDETVNLINKHLNNSDQLANEFNNNLSNYYNKVEIDSKLYDLINDPKKAISNDMPNIKEIIIKDIKNQFYTKDQVIDLINSK